MSGDRGTQKSLSPDAYFSVSVFVSEPSLPARKDTGRSISSANDSCGGRIIGRSFCIFCIYIVFCPDRIPADIESSQIPVLIVGCKKKDHVVICGIIAFRCSGKFRFLCGVFRSTSVV